MVKFKTYEGYLLNIIKSEEENEQMAKLTGYYAVAVIEEVTCCCKKTIIMQFLMTVIHIRPGTRF